jgi:hypothetical protein
MAINQNVKSMMILQKTAQIELLWLEKRCFREEKCSASAINPVQAVRILIEPQVV